MSSSQLPNRKPQIKTLQDIRRSIEEKLSQKPSEQEKVSLLPPKKNENEERSREMVSEMLSQGSTAGNYAIPEQSGQLNLQSNPFQSGGLQPLQPLGTQGQSSPGLMEYMQERGGQEDPSERVFDTNINRLLAAAPGKVTITSQKRDNNRQRQLWEDALKKYGSVSAARKWVAPPRGLKLPDGSVAQGSQHERGLAADLNFENDAVRRWVHDNASRFGIHFPLDNEPWHAEIVGSRG
jgi:hypothetical protein